MKTLSKKIAIALCTVACLCFGTLALTQLNSNKVNVSAAIDVSFESSQAAMIDGASIRLNVADHGIRFTTFIGRDSGYYAGIDDGTYELYTMFLPKAALGDEELLEVDKTYKNGVSPAVAQYVMNNAGSDSSIGDGKLFNAVLDLSDVTNIPNALNKSIVARSYIKNVATQEITYIPNDKNVERAPAYVAVKEIEDGSKNSTLGTYVQHVQVSIENHIVGENDTVTLSATTNVDGLVPSNFNVGTEKVVGNTYTAGRQNDLTITANVGNGLKYSNSAKLAVIANQYTFHNENFTPEGEFVIDHVHGAYKVSNESGELENGVDYRIENETLYVNKSALVSLDKPSTGDLIITSLNSQARVSVENKVAEFTNFADGQLGTEVFNNCLGVKSMSIVDEKVEVTPFGTMDVGIRFNADYLRALFAYPRVNALGLNMALNDVSTNIGYPAVSGEDSKTQNTAGTAGTYKTITGNRAAFNLFNKNGSLSSFQMTVDESALDTSTKILIDYVALNTDSGDNLGTNIYADAQLILSKGLQLDSPVSSEYVTDFIGGSYSRTYTAEAYKVNVPSSYVNGAVRSSVATQISTPYGIVWGRLNTYAMVDDNQYVTVDAEDVAETYTYDLGLSEGQTILCAYFNGAPIAQEKINGDQITFNVQDDLYGLFGHQALTVYVERLVSGAVDATPVDMYYKSICVVYQADWNSALHFENGMSPFISIIGGSGVVAEVIDSEDLGNVYYGVYADTHVYSSNPEAVSTDTTGYGDIKNNKLLKLTIPSGTVKIYVYSKYFVARIAKVKEISTSTGVRMVAFTINSDISWTTVAADGVTAINSTSNISVATTNQNPCRQIVSSYDDILNVIYDSETGTIQEGNEYFTIVFAEQTSEKIVAFDDIFCITGSGLHQANQNKLSLIGTYPTV